METHWDLTEGVRKPPWWDVHTFFWDWQMFLRTHLPVFFFIWQILEVTKFPLSLTQGSTDSVSALHYFFFLSCCLPKFLRIFWEELMFTVLLRLSVQHVKTSRLDSNELFKTSLQIFCGCAIWAFRSRSSLTTLAMPEWNYATLARPGVMKSLEVREQEVSGVIVCNPPLHCLPLTPAAPENRVQMLKGSYET